MIAADRPVQRPRNARMLVVDAGGRIRHAFRSRFIDLLRPGDLLVANDAATLPASLHGVHLRSGDSIEVRLAGRPSVALDDVQTFSALVFGTGDFRTRTEDRPLPPSLETGDRVEFGSVGKLTATIEGFFDHPRLVALRFGGSAGDVWSGLARHGRPIQYAHMPAALELGDVWTPIAAMPVAFEAPSATFAVDWRLIGALRARGIGFQTITLAAGLSSTGDSELDKRLPLDEPYRIPENTAHAIRLCRTRGGRVVAAGTTVVRALEHSASVHGHVRAGDGLATQRVGPARQLRIVDAILSGTHEPGVSHFELLRAFADDDTLAAATAELEAFGYRTHEFGDSVFIEQIANRNLTRSDAALETTVPALTSLLM